jgi:hypothetical protein
MILRAVVTFIITWQLFEFIYNVLLPDMSNKYVAVLALAGSFGVGFVAGERVNILQEVRDSMLIITVSCIGLVIATILIAIFGIESIFYTYIIEILFLVLFGFLGKNFYTMYRIQVNDNVRDRLKMVTTAFLGASIATEGLRKII